MRSVVATTAVFVLSGGIEGCAIAMQARVPSAADSLLARTQLDGVLSDHFRYLLRTRPDVAAWAGMEVAGLPDLSLDRAKRDAIVARSALSALDEVEVVALTEDGYVSWQALRWGMEHLAGAPAFHWTRLWDAMPDVSALATAAAILAQQPVTDTRSAGSYVALVQRVETLVQDIRRGYEERADRGIRLARPLLPLTVAYVRSFLAPPEESPFGVPSGFLISGDSLFQAPFVREVSGAVTQRINLALESLAAYLEGPYALEAPERIGLWQYPGGPAHYAMLLEQASTLDITPEDAHAAGVREVARLAARAAAARAEAGLPVNRDSLRAVLATEERFRATAPDEVVPAIGRFYEDVVRRLDSLFLPAPVTPVSLGMMASDEEAQAPLWRYEPASVRHPIARFRVNGARLSRRSLLTLPALVYEGLMPGLHHQLAGQLEDGELPDSRRVDRHAGFVDGWQAYALEVADSLSGTLSAAQRFGVRLRELAYACGLVIDTGINALGWTRADALGFLRSYLPDDDEELEREFIVVAAAQPGRLAAGALGARELRGMRRWAERELGERFSLAAFHREVLRVGSVPLPVLGSHLERWIWEQRQAVPPGSGVPADTGAVRRPPAP